MRTDNEIGLLVALWCGKIWDRVQTDGASHQFCFGFLAGEVVVETSAGRISNQGRLEVEAGRFKISQTETDQSKANGSFGGQLGFELPKWLGFAKGAADVGGHLNRTVSKIEQKANEQYRVFWRVADAGFNFWRVFGVGLNEHNVLENKILGDEPLCHIITEGAEKVEVTVSFRCDLRDLWFRLENPGAGPLDPRFEKQQEERNRVAVASRIVAIALKRKTSEVDTSPGWGMVTLARQRLRSVSSRKSERRVDEK